MYLPKFAIFKQLHVQCITNDECDKTGSQGPTYGERGHINCIKLRDPEKRFEVKEKSKRSSHRIFVNGSCALFWSGLIRRVDRPKEVFNLKPVYWFMSANLPMFLSIFKSFAGLYILFINILNVYFHSMGHDFSIQCLNRL